MNTRRAIIWLILIFTTGVGYSQQHFNILIKNGDIVDGTGSARFKGDVGIVKDKIVKIGDLSGSTADSVIDAAGLIVAPGFIDVHTHIEGDEAKTPTADNFIYDGVTSVITGNCGSSRLDIKHYFDTLRIVKLSVNVGTLIGHNDVRTKVMGQGDIAPNKAQLKEMETLQELSSFRFHFNIIFFFLVTILSSFSL